MIFKYLILIIIGLCSGALISCAVFSFIAMIGAVPRFIQKTRTEKYTMFYENVIIAGGIFGGLYEFFEYRLPGNNIILAVFGLGTGIFVGSLAVCLAEVLDVIPILCRRVGFKYGLGILMFSIAIGKLTGSLLYLLVPGFFSY